MSNEVVQRRCRRSPTGIEDCQGFTGGTGSTGDIGGLTDFFFDEIDEDVELDLGDPVAFLFQTPIVVDTGQLISVQAEFLYLIDTAVSHTISAWLAVDDIIIVESAKIYLAGTLNQTYQGLVQRLLTLDPGAYTISLALEVNAGEGIDVEFATILGEIA